jgi:cytidylate kinase
VKALVVDQRGVHPEESFKEFQQHIQSGELDLDKLVDSEIEELLEEGDLIVEGRSAFMLMERNIFKVLLVASETFRAKHIANRRNITIDEVNEILRISDDEREHLVNRMLKKDWLDPHNYNLVVNTGLRSFEETADLILKAMQTNNSITD